MFYYWGCYQGFKCNFQTNFEWSIDYFLIYSSPKYDPIGLDFVLYYTFFLGIGAYIVFTGEASTSTGCLAMFVLFSHIG